MKKKMVLIGAGSAAFSQGLIGDLINKQPGGHEWSLALCDIDEEVLQDITMLAKKMVRAKNANIEIISSPDRRELLPGADYVVSTIGVGGRRAWEKDVYIPRKYGIYQPVGDTALPGGISRAMRMVPQMVDIVKDTRELAPQAKFFNYSNPMAVICRALHKAVDFPVTGLCSGTQGCEWSIADHMGYDRSRFSTLAAGINHCTFMYDFRLDGKSVKKEVMEKIRKDHYDDMLFLNDFMQRYGVFTAPGDRHVTEFFTEYFPDWMYYGKRLGVDIFSFEGTIEHGDQIHDSILKMARTDEELPASYFDELGDHGHTHGEQEQLIDMIDSMETDSRKTFFANVPNGGAVANLPPWAVIEMPCIASSQGLTPIRLNGYPDMLAAMTSRFLANVELTAEAALKGDRELMAEAIMMGGYIQDRNAVYKMVDELIEAQKEYLPQF